MRRRDEIVNRLLLEAMTFLNFGSSTVSDDPADSDLEAEEQSRFDIGSKLFYHHLMCALRIARYQEFQKRIIALMLKHRYLDARVPLPESMDWLSRILLASPDYIFEQNVRMTRRSFAMLVDLLESKCGHFLSAGPRGRQQLPIGTQLHLALYCIGFYGNGAGLEQDRSIFGYGVGMVKNARDRVVNPLLSLTSHYIKWPSPSARRSLCRRVHQHYGFQNAFFSVDGTSHKFAFVPRYDSSSWYDRKSRYSMQALVTDDMDFRVINLVVGWPGSAHDARVLQSADYMNPNKSSTYFKIEQHGVVDAAFGVYHRVIPNYKEPLASIPENAGYNKNHSNFRIRSEHTIGLATNRFQGIREVRMKLRRMEHVLGIVKFITSAHVLHNILLSFGDTYVPDDGAVNAEDTSEREPVEDLEAEIDSPAVVQSPKEFRERVKRQVLTFVGFE